MIDKSLDDEDLRTALFRFVDVLPSLGSAREVGDHLQEYFSHVDHALGGLSILAGSLRAGWVVAPLVQRNVTTLARRFLVEDDEKDLVAAVEALRTEPSGFTLDVVGEAVVSEGEAEGMLPPLRAAPRRDDRARREVARDRRRSIAAPRASSRA